MKMKHPRTLIREAVRDRLVAQLSAIDPRITAARISIHRDRQRPDRAIQAVAEVRGVGTG